MTMSFHSFAQRDAPKHFEQDGFNTSKITPQMTNRHATMINVPGEVNRAITIADLKPAASKKYPHEFAMA